MHFIVTNRILDRILCNLSPYSSSVVRGRSPFPDIWILYKSGCPGKPKPQGVSKKPFQFPPKLLHKENPIKPNIFILLLHNKRCLFCSARIQSTASCFGIRYFRVLFCFPNLPQSTVHSCLSLLLQGNLLPAAPLLLSESVFGSNQVFP